MEKAHSIEEFAALGARHASETSIQGDYYLNSHIDRLYNTYITCLQLSKSSATKLISFGAGSAYIENALTHWHNIDVTIIDFPETIDRLGPLYQKCGFKTIAGDLSNEIKVQEKFDIALSSEVIEHIPRPPAEHIRFLRGAVRDGGDIIVTTPNFANIRVVGRLLFMRPVLPSPERTFGPISFENESAHRREYLPSEMLDAFKTAGVRHLGTVFTENANDRRFVLRCATKVVPRFRATMILHGRKETTA